MKFKIKTIMKINRKKSVKIIGILAIAGIIIGGGTAYYLFNMPHRDVQNQTVDYSLTSTELVNEYLADANVANEKYLSEDGDSKILEITGVVEAINEDFNGQRVVVLKTNSDKAGVNCSFTAETNVNAEQLKVGQKATIKGVIRSGASYDADLEMYVNATVEKCNVVK